VPTGLVPSPEPDDAFVGQSVVEHHPLSFRTVGVFTAGGVVLAVMTVVLVIAHT
jgi:hypothetical protein